MQRSGVRSPFAPLRPSLVTGLLTLAALAALGCGSFGSSESSEPPTNPADDGGAADGSGADSSSGAGTCPAACDTPCVGAVCPPYEFATGLHTGAPRLLSPVSIEIDDTGIYIGDRGGGTTEFPGGVWSCGTPAKGATCAAAAVFTIPDFDTFTLAPNSFYFATSSAMQAQLVGKVARGSGAPVTSTFGQPVVRLAAGTTSFMTLAANGGLWACNADASNCVAASNGASVDGVAAHGAFYCVTGVENGEVGVHCHGFDGLSRAFVAQEPAAAMLGPISLVAGGAYWAAGEDIHSVDLDATGKTAPGATTQLLSAPGHGAFAPAADGGLVYYAVGKELFVANRNGQSAARSLSSVPAPITAIAVYGDYVYFAYGPGSTSSLARVPK
jgi:hypothetical protein